jgi:hypothetical protein
MFWSTKFTQEWQLRSVFARAKILRNRVFQTFFLQRQLPLRKNGPSAESTLLPNFRSAKRHIDLGCWPPYDTAAVQFNFSFGASMNSKDDTQTIATDLNPGYLNPGGPQIPMWIKIAYTAFVAVLVPYYWYAYGPTNFLFFCDIALFLTLAAVWKESSLLASMAGVGILFPQALWMADFLGTLVGFPITGMTGYMFDTKYSLFVRGLSFFHFWLPILLVYLVWRLGYDKQAFRGWTLLAWAVLFVCYS